MASVSALTTRIPEEYLRSSRTRAPSRIQNKYLEFAGREIELSKKTLADCSRDEVIQRSLNRVYNDVLAADRIVCNGVLREIPALPVLCENIRLVLRGIENELRYSEPVSTNVRNEFNRLYGRATLLFQSIEKAPRKFLDMATRLQERTRPIAMPDDRRVAVIKEINHYLHVAKLFTLITEENAQTIDAQIARDMNALEEVRGVLNAVAPHMKDEIRRNIGWTAEELEIERDGNLVGLSATHAPLYTIEEGVEEPEVEFAAPAPIVAAPQPMLHRTSAVARPYIYSTDASVEHCRRLAKKRELDTARTYVPHFYIAPHMLVKQTMATTAKPTVELAPVVVAPRRKPREVAAVANAQQPVEQDPVQAHIKRLRGERDLKMARTYVPVFYVPQHKLVPMPTK